MSTNGDMRELRELATRAADGVRVGLLWRPGSTNVVVEMVDSQLDERIVVDVPGDQALDAFHHPFAYAARCEPMPMDPSQVAIQVDS